MQGYSVYKQCYCPASFLMNSFCVWADRVGEIRVVTGEMTGFDTVFIYKLFVYKVGDWSV